MKLRIDEWNAIIKALEIARVELHKEGDKYNTGAVPQDVATIKLRNQAFAESAQYDELCKRIKKEGLA